MRILGIFGILVHELSHFILLLVTGAKPSYIRVSYRQFNGSVGLKDFERMSFLQLFLAGLAPLLVISYLEFYCWFVFLTPSFDEMFRIIAFILSCSLFLGSTPSRADIRAIIGAFNTDPLYSLYQIGVVMLAAGIVYLLSFMVIIPYYVSFVYYILIGLVYYFLKYLFIGIRKCCSMVYVRVASHSPTVTSSDMYRKRHIPKKERKQKIERRQW